MTRMVKFIALGMGAALLGFSPMAAAETRYVSPAGQHVYPFTSWEEAATNIQSAINACNPGDLVRVADGTYSLAATLRVTNEVTVASENGRDAVLLDGSSLPANQDAVFLQFGTLNGLTVSNAPRHGIKSEYGYVLNSRITHSGQTGIDSYTTPRIVTNSTLVVTNTIVEKSGLIGIFTCAVDTRILGCVITESADAGVSLRQNDTTGVIQVPRVSNFLIRASTVASNLNSGISLAFWNFTEELPAIPVRIEDCLIEHNVGVRGGGIADSGGVTTDRSSGVQILNSVIRRNYASVRGGGVSLFLNRSPSIRHSLILENQSAGNGGGIHMLGGSANNCLIRDNVGASDGGGVFGGGVVNCTILFNYANRGGGTAQSSVHNSIIYYNRNGSNIHTNNFAGSLSYSCTIPAAPGTGNISAPPSLAGFYNWRLVAGSPGIDAGSLWLATDDVDLDGDPRIWGPEVDMGCDEFYPPSRRGPLSVIVKTSADRAVVGTPIVFECDVEGRPESYRWDFTDGVSRTNQFFVTRSFDTPGIYTATVTAWNPDGAASTSISVEIFPGYTNYVSPAGMHVFPFTNGVDAATNIQDAISANIPGGVVLVDDGVYDVGAVAINGGLPARIAITNVLEVISINGPDSTQIVGQGPLGEAAVRCAYVGAGARLAGFTLRNGHTRMAGDMDRDQSGGGAWCEPGGIVEDCVVVDNAAHYVGGGIRNGTVRNTTLHGNHAMHGGGASGADLIQCIVSNNAAAAEGGGVHGGTLVNTLVVNNAADFGGGVARASLHHATVAYNEALQSGGGIYWSVASNSIIYWNHAGASWSNYFNSICRYSCTTPDPQSTGTVLEDPRFADPANGVFRLRGDSPVLGAAFPTDLAVDLLGVPRPLPNTLQGTPSPDMGAYEYTAAHYVAPGGGHVYPFLTWANAAHDLQSAIDAADPMDHVFVSNGVYATGGRVHNGALTNRVVIDKAIRVMAVRGAAQTVIEGAGPVGDSAVRGVYLGPDALLSGFTVRGGATRALGDELEDQSGGGIWAAAGAVISNCVVEASAAHAFGGGVRGGRLVNTFLNANQAAWGGGLAHGEIEFCTVTANSAVNGGGAYECTGRYSIVYFNEASAEGPNTLGGTWDTCCITPDPGGPGHVTGDPRLLSLNDYRLASDSPCIDAIPSPVGYPGEDLDGTPRPLDGNASGTAHVDIGAQEYIHPTADTDGDGLSDWDEIHLHGTDPLRWDTDGDGQSDGAEIMAGTDPLDPDSYFTITRIVHGEEGPVFLWPALAGRLYTVLTTDDLLGGVWTNRPDYTDHPGVNGFLSFTNETPPGLAIYRVGIRMAP